LFETATVAGRAPSFSDLVGSFADSGPQGLNNGLDVVENERLFATDDVDEVVSLLLRGLRRVTDAA
jgi:hypothetical protein